MADKKHPVAPWEMMAAAKEAVGMSALQKIFSVGHTQINKFCRNPEFTEEWARSPIERLRIMIRKMVDAGAGEEARTIVTYLADELGCNVTKRKHHINHTAGPVALISAVSKLMELEENPEVSRAELVQAANQVIEEAEIIVFRRFPHQVAFGRMAEQEPQISKRTNFWLRLFRRSERT